MGEQVPQGWNKHLTERYGLKLVSGIEKIRGRALASKSVSRPSPKAKHPPGGFDSTPIPHAPPGYTLKFTIHRAVNLLFGDLASLSSDPFVSLRLVVDLPCRHKEDPDMVFRTPTITKNVNPVWNSEWIVANVPASGFVLKCRIYDEDSADHDDRLGDVSVRAESISEKWTGISEQSYKVKKRKSSKRAHLLTSIAAACSKTIDVNGLLFVSVKVLEKTPGDEGGQIYTIGPNYWTKHYCPLIGRLTGVKDSIDDGDGKGPVMRYKYVHLERHAFKKD